MLPQRYGARSPADVGKGIPAEGAGVNKAVQWWGSSVQRARRGHRDGVTQDVTDHTQEEFRFSPES